jgi:transglutaminase-like putative cysteine protease
MSFAKLHKVVTYLVAGLGLFALTLGRELPATATALIALGYAASWFAEGPLLAREGYSKLWNRAVVAFLVIQVLRGFGAASILSLGIEFAAFLQISRLFHRREARDHQHIAVLAFLHLIAATVLSTGLDYAAVFLGFVLVTPWMLALTHLRAEVEGNYQAGEGAHQQGDVARVLASKRVAGPGFLAGTSLLALPLFAVTALLFLLFPRVGMGFLSFGGDSGRNVAGFGRNVQLGGFGVIRDDPTVVLRVKTSDREGASSTSSGAAPSRSFRLRGTSFDHYDGAQWTRTGRGNRRLPQVQGRYPIRRWPDPDRDPRLSFVLDPLDEQVLFLPERVVGLGLEPRIEGGRRRFRKLFLAPGLDVRYADNDGLRLEYEAFIAPEDEPIPPEPLEPEARALYLQLPSGQQRVARLARKVVAGATTDAERAARIERYLRDSGRFRYTLEQPDTKGKEPLEVFLFEAQAGHCEYFSTAMAIMLRAAGVPSRNVTGFVGGSYNRYGEYYAIRQGDAHSWVEGYVDGRFRTYDPTPPARHAVAGEPGLLDQLRAAIDALRVRWSSQVVDYDMRRQLRVFREIGAFFSRFGASSEKAPGRDARERSETRELPWWPVALAGALALFAALGFVLLRRLRRRSARRGTREAREVVRLYRELERALARCGRERPMTRTPLEHAELLEAQRFPGSNTVREVTDAYLASRYGGQPLSPDRLSALRARIPRDLRPPR